MRLPFLLPALFPLIISFPLAADFQQGMDAYNSGNYTRAFNEWLLVASETNGEVSSVEQAKAQFGLSFLYTEGRGIPQNKARAVFWLRKAAENRHPLALEMITGRPGANSPGAAGTGGRDETKPTVSGLSAVPAAGQAIRSAEWILAQDPSHYTVQLMAVARDSDVHALTAKHPALQPFAGYRLQREGKTFHVLIQGVYPSFKAAREAVGNYPETLTRGNEPWIRKLGGVHQVLEGDSKHQQ